MEFIFADGVDRFRITGRIGFICNTGIGYPKLDIASGVISCYLCRHEIFTFGLESNCAIIFPNLK